MAVVRPLRDVEEAVRPVEQPADLDAVDLLQTAGHRRGLPHDRQRRHERSGHRLDLQRRIARPARPDAVQQLSDAEHEGAIDLDRPEVGLGRDHKRRIDRIAVCDRVAEGRLHGVALRPELLQRPVLVPAAVVEAAVPDLQFAVPRFRVEHDDRAGADDDVIDVAAGRHGPVVQQVPALGRQRSDGRSDRFLTDGARLEVRGSRCGPVSALLVTLAPTSPNVLPPDARQHPLPRVPSTLPLRARTLGNRCAPRPMAPQLTVTRGSLRRIPGRRSVDTNQLDRVGKTRKESLTA